MTGERRSRRILAALASRPELLTTAIAFFVYLVTLAPGLTWSHFGQDGGDLIVAATSFGVAHPPGYPLFGLLGKLISSLPLGNVASRFNLLSALSVAAASGFTTAFIREQLSKEELRPSPSSDAAALAAGLSFALAPLVWGQAVITEVYGPNLALNAAFLWALFGRRPSWLAGFLLGLGITCHLTTLFLIPLAIVNTAPKDLPRLGAAALAGLTPLLLIPLMASSGSQYVWGEPTTIRGWWWLVSGQLYRHNVFAFPMAQMPGRLLEWGRTLLAQYSPFSPVLLAVSLFRAESVNHPRIAGMLLTALLYIAYSVGYNSGDAAVYLLPSIMLVAPLISPALQAAGRFAFLLPLSSLLLNFGQVNLKHETSLPALAGQLLDHTPANAILVTPGDASIFALWYYQAEESIRPDVILVDRGLFAFDWYRRRLARFQADLGGLAEDDLKAFQAANEGRRPYCEVGPSLSFKEMILSTSCSARQDSGLEGFSAFQCQQNRSVPVPVGAKSS